ncbi:GGDEF domain-containing protein, partial [Lactobacillus nasalidis]
RRGFLEQLDLRPEIPAKLPLTIAFIDLDDFKFVNDVYGHVVGDLALKNLAGHLITNFPPETLIGRTGGDEFCAAIPKDKAEARKLVEEAVRGVQEFTADGKQVRYTISAGYADFPSQADTVKDLVTQADAALYAAKMHGKHAAKHFEPEMKRVKRAQLGFNVKNVAQGLPGGILIYRADDQEREILFANDYLV